jgi:hypothetical protein
MKTQPIAGRHERRQALVAQEMIGAVEGENAETSSAVGESAYVTQLRTGGKIVIHEPLAAPAEMQ